jgi:hypothetical protein
MYSRKIVGYDLSGSLELNGCVRALNKAYIKLKTLDSLYTVRTAAYSIVAMFTPKTLRGKRLESV